MSRDVICDFLTPPLLTPSLKWHVPIETFFKNPLFLIIIFRLVFSTGPDSYLAAFSRPEDIVKLLRWRMKNYTEKPQLFNRISLPRKIEPVFLNHASCLNWTHVYHLSLLLLIISSAVPWSITFETRHLLLTLISNRATDITAKRSRFYKPLCKLIGCFNLNSYLRLLLVEASSSNNKAISTSETFYSKFLSPIPNEDFKSLLKRT